MGCGGSKKGKVEDTANAGPVDGESDGQVGSDVDVVRAYVVRGQPSEGFGFGIGATQSGEILVTDLVPGGPADGTLQLADRLDKVNGMPTANISFESVLDKVASSLVLMLECSRLKTLRRATKVQDMDLRVHVTSIKHVMPDMKFKQRRPSVGRQSISRSPTLSGIREGEDEEDDGADEAAEPELHSIELSRPRKDDAFGFGIVDDKEHNGFFTIYHVSSNIHNWGLVQVGDKIRKINDESCSSMTLLAATERINAGVNVVLGIEREEVVSMNATTVSKRGSVSMTFAPGLLISKLNVLQQERAIEEGQQGDDQSTKIERSNSPLRDEVMPETLQEKEEKAKLALASESEPEAPQSAADAEAAGAGASDVNSEPRDSSGSVELASTIAGIITASL